MLLHKGLKKTSNKIDESLNETLEKSGMNLFDIKRVYNVLPDDKDSPSFDDSSWKGPTQSKLKEILDPTGWVSSLLDNDDTYEKMGKVLETLISLADYSATKNLLADKSLGRIFESYINEIDYEKKEELLKKAINRLPDYQTPDSYVKNKMFDFRVKGDLYKEFYSIERKLEILNSKSKNVRSALIDFLVKDDNVKDLTERYNTLKKKVEFAKKNKITSEENVDLLYYSEMEYKDIKTIYDLLDSKSNTNNFLYGKFKTVDCKKKLQDTIKSTRNKKLNISAALFALLSLPKKEIGKDLEKIFEKYFAKSDYQEELLENSNSR